MQTLSVWKSLKYVLWESINFLPNDNISEQSKSKAFADDLLSLVNPVPNDKF